MRIAFLVNEFPRLSETFVLNQAIGLIDRGHEVDIYANDVLGPEQAHPDVDRYGLWQHTYSLRKVPKSLILRWLLGLWLLVRYGHTNPGMFGRAINPFRHSPKVWLGLRPLYMAVVLADKGPYDIVHGQFGPQGYDAVNGAELLRPRPQTVVTFRGYDISAILQRRGNDYYKPLFKKANLFLTNCDFFRQRAINHGCDPAKINVHRSGLDSRKFPYRPRPSMADRGICLVTTGRLVEKKGIEYVIRAVAVLLADYPTLQYRILGDGPLKADLQQLIQSLNLSQTVSLEGWKNEQQILEILGTSDLFVAPSVTAQDGNQDAPVNVLKEAMALGMPVVSTWHGGIPELVEHDVNGLLVPERDVQALVEQLRYLIDHPERWEAMGQAGRKKVIEEYDLQALNDRLVERYQGLLPRAETADRAQAMTYSTP